MRATQRGPTIDRYPKITRFHPRATILLAVALLVAAAVLLPLWATIPEPDPVRTEATVINVQILPSPAKVTVQQQNAQSPPPIPAPAGEPIEHRDESIAEQIAEDGLALPQPTTSQPSLEHPLSTDAPPGWNQAVQPPTANASTTIAGDGDNIGSTGCGVTITNFNAVTTRLRGLFAGDKKLSEGKFRVKARLWFDTAGHVQRAELLQSTGSEAHDATVKELLGNLDIGMELPKCAQPVTVWIGQPTEVRLETGAIPEPVEAAHVASPPQLASSPTSP